MIIHVPGNELTEINANTDWFAKIGICWPDLNWNIGIVIKKTERTKNILNRNSQRLVWKRVVFQIILYTIALALIFFIARIQADSLSAK